MSTTEPADVMTAEDHIREAERLLERGEHNGDEPYLVAVDTARAQVHATLAQALKAADLLPVMVKLADWVASDSPAEPETAS